MEVLRIDRRTKRTRACYTVDILIVSEVDIISYHVTAATVRSGQLTPIVLPELVQSEYSAWKKLRSTSINIENKIFYVYVEAIAEGTKMNKRMNM